MFEAAVITSLLLLMLKVYAIPDPQTREASLLHKPMVKFTPKLFELLRPYLPGAGYFHKELSATFRKQNIFDETTDPKKRL